VFVAALEKKKRKELRGSDKLNSSEGEEPKRRRSQTRSKVAAASGLAGALVSPSKKERPTEGGESPN